MSTIEQLELALEIVKSKRAGNPLDWECNFVEGWKPPQRDPFWCLVHGGEIRLKPWTLGREINGHTLPEGKEWYGGEWTEDMLPAPFRPMMKGERVDSKSELLLGHWRTTRPIPKPSILTDEQKAAGWIEWHGGENPIPGKRCFRLYRNTAIPTTNAVASEGYDWCHRKTGGDIVAYRVEEWVDLGPEDVPPGSVIRHAGAPDAWWQVLRVHENYIVISPTAHMSELSYAFLRHNDREINRSLSTGAWDPNAWEPCRKEVV